MLLTDSRIKSEKPGTKPVRLSDGDGLYVLVTPKGGRWWRFDYTRPSGGRNTLSLGTYPEVSLKQARVRREELRAQEAAGIDPATKRQAEKEALADTFEAVAREWHAKLAPGWAESHSEKIIRRLERDLFPYIGKLPVGAIEAPELLRALQRIEKRGKLETAHRAHQNCGQVFRYAVATGRAKRDPSADLRGALAPWKPQHYASIHDPQEIGALLRDIYGYVGSQITSCALKLAPLCIVRPGELRRAEWAEIDLENAEWRIPAEKMKARVQHLVPLSKQATSIFSELQMLTGAGRFVFPGRRSPKEPMSDNALNAALRRMGYAKEQMDSLWKAQLDCSQILAQKGRQPAGVEVIVEGNYADKNCHSGIANRDGQLLRRAERKTRRCRWSRKSLRVQARECLRQKQRAA